MKFCLYIHIHITYMHIYLYIYSSLSTLDMGAKIYYHIQNHQQINDGVRVRRGSAAAAAAGEVVVVAMLFLAGTGK